MKRALSVISIFVACTALGFAQAKPVPSEVASSQISSPVASKILPPGFQERNPRYRLRKGDSFDLDLAFTPELNQTVAVQPDGYVTLKQAGSIFVEGKTVPELTETVKLAYSKVLHDPIVEIVLRDFERPYFIASGQVTKPGKYDLRGPLTVSEAVAIAGGFNDQAKHSQVVLFRPMPDGVFEAKLINVKHLLASHNLSEDVALKPGDMVYVPQSSISKIRKFIPNSNIGAYYNPANF